MHACTDLYARIPADTSAMLVSSRVRADHARVVGQNVYTRHVVFRLDLPPRSADVQVDRMLRVDHAGELGADRIYAGQLAVLRHTDVGPVIQVRS